MLEKYYKNIIAVYIFVVFLVFCFLIKDLFFGLSIPISKVQLLNSSLLENASAGLDERNYGLSGSPVELDNYQYGNPNPFR